MSGSTGGVSEEPSATAKGANAAARSVEAARIVNMVQKDGSKCSLHTTGQEGFATKRSPCASTAGVPKLLQQMTRASDVGFCGVGRAP